ncbi:MAG TPA: OB-fold domain-containing protein [Acidimicrobiia bacterium]|nr:OB-fold domain-containing protein [Acidimicrobiia bacterium]
MSGFSIERDERSAPFFDAAAEGRLLIRRCEVCGAAYAPHVARCRDGEELTWEEASGDGTLVTWAVEHTAPLDPVLAAPDGSVVFGFVELTEGPWLQVPIVDVEPSTLRAGVDMHVRFVRPGDGEAMPAFAPITGAPAP